MASSDKRLARLLGKLLEHPQVLSADGKGGFVGVVDGRPAFQLPAKLAAAAISRGLLEPGGVDGVMLSDVAGHWLRRINAPTSALGASANPFSFQHWRLEEREVFDPSGDLIAVQVNVENSPLLRLYRQRDEQGQGFLAAVEFAAGEKFRQDYALSAMGRVASSNWSSLRQAKGAVHDDGPHIRALDARRRVMNALVAVGPVLDRILFSLLIREQAMSVLERESRWPRRSAKVILKVALARLAHHYGLYVPNGSKELY